MTVPFMYNFRTFNVKQIPNDFLEFNFSQFHYPDLGNSSKKKRKPQIFGLKNVIERGIILTFVIC